MGEWEKRMPWLALWDGRRYGEGMAGSLCPCYGQFEGRRDWGKYMLKPSVIMLPMDSDAGLASCWMWWCEWGHGLLLT